MTSALDGGERSGSNSRPLVIMMEGKGGGGETNLGSYSVTEIDITRLLNLNVLLLKWIVTSFSPGEARVQSLSRPYGIREAKWY
jgi:hypothetical protein